MGGGWCLLCDSDAAERDLAVQMDALSQVAGHHTDGRVSSLTEQCHMVMARLSGQRGPWEMPPELRPNDQKPLGENPESAFQEAGSRDSARAGGCRVLGTKALALMRGAPGGHVGLSGSGSSCAGQGQRQW